MGVATRALGAIGTIMLLHAGYSAFESLTYEKSLDPDHLEIPLDVGHLSTTLMVDQARDHCVSRSALPSSGIGQRRAEAYPME